jgi:putative heme-binding domain-containing protein
MLALLILAGLLPAAQAPPGAAGPPINGEQLYMENCAECHGPEGDAVPDVDLGHGRFRRATTDPELVGIVLRGIPNTAMPPNNFSEAQAAAIVRYLRDKASRAALSAGNVENGRAVFAGKGNCVSCHRVNGVGARIAPDLSEIGRLRHSTDLERAIVDPDVMIVPSNRFVRLVTREGATITGRLLNQDVFTVQLLDSKEQLRAVARSELREFTFVDKSPMPSYRDKLSRQELTDLVSFLVSLQGGGTQ